MKIRNDFVTNSSSSSFVVSLIAVDEKSGQEVVLAKTEEMSGDYNGESYEFCGKRVPTTDPDDVRGLLLEHFRGKPIDSKRKGTITRLLNYMKSKGLDPANLTHLALLSHCWTGSDCHDDIEWPIEQAWKNTPVTKETPREQAEEMALPCHTDVESILLYIEYLNGRNPCYTSRHYEFISLQSGEKLERRELLDYMEEKNDVLGTLREMLAPPVKETFEPVDLVTSPPKDFIVSKGVMKVYKGQGGDIVVPRKVTAIGSEAFKDCTTVTSVVLPEWVTEIESDAFEDCTSLTSVVISKNVTKISSRAFGGCTALASIQVEEGNEAYYCEGGCLVEKKGNELIIACPAATSFVIPKSVAKIYAGMAFGNCTARATVVVEAGNEVYYSENNCVIERQSNELILGCAASVIPEGVTTIRQNAFRNCAALTSITIPNGVIEIEGDAFRNCGALTTISLPQGLEILGNRNMFSYAGGALQNCTSLTHIEIPQTVTRIGESTFANCTSLTSVAIPKSVTEIGWRAFNGCTGLTSVTIPDSVTSIGLRAFLECARLTSVVIPNSVTSIGSGAFEDCTGLTFVTIPDSVTEIGWRAFNGCTGLTSVTIPNSVTKIGDSAFEGCKGLTSVTIPSSVTSIGSGAFEDCTGLTSVTIPGSVTEIDSAFFGCTGLTSVIIPEGVTKIGMLAFSGCTGLTSITIPTSVTEIGGSAFSHCTSLTSITISEGVTSIGSNAFRDCTGLTSVTIPSSVTSIGEHAFYGCTGLTSVTIPDSVTSIEYDAFEGCENATIYCAAKKQPEGWDRYWRSGCKAKVIWGYKPE